MSIVCGIDFSENSMRAARAAALLAARSRMPLHLVYTIELSAEEIFREPREKLVRWAEGELRAAADKLRPLGAEISVRLEYGHPDERLQEVAAEVDAKLLVVGALGGRRPGKWQLGSHAERVAHAAHTPTLVVRDGDSFDAWARGERALRVMLGVDHSLSSEAAMRWVGELSALGPCEVTAVHCYWPPEQFARLGLGGVRSFVEPGPEVDAALRRELEPVLMRTLGALPSKLVIIPSLGRIGDRLTLLADEAHADLVVVGSHGREGAARIAHGSVSHDVVKLANVSVACVPGPVLTHAKEPAKLSSVLVATDFSATGNAAIPLAYGAVREGGTVHLVHVSAGDKKQAVRDIFAAEASGNDVLLPARQELLKLVPQDPGRVFTKVHLLEAQDAALAICQAAERLNVDLVCVGTHGYGGLKKAVLGSVAQSVLHGTSRPLLFARKPVE